MKPFRALFGWGLFATILLALAAILLAYQVRPSYNLDVGGPTDAPYLEGVNGNEHDPADSSITYRWTMADAWLKLPAMGRQDFVVTLDLSGYRPEGQPPAHMIVSVAPGPHQPGKQIADWSLDNTRRPYTVEVSRHDTGADGLYLQLLTDPPFSPPGDSRELGTLLFGVELQPGTGADRFVEPPLGDMVKLIVATTLFGVVLALAGWGNRGVLIGGVGWVGLIAGFLIADRPWLGLAETGLLQALVAALILVALLRLIVPRLYRLGGIDLPPRTSTVLHTIFALAFIFRLAGQLHPEIYIVDLVFHSHRFDDVLGGKLLFTIKSAEWNNHETFYLPTAYIFMIPLRWLINDNLLVIRLFTVGLDSLAVFLMYYLGRRAMGSSKAGLFAAAFYVTLPLGVLPFSWGITTNVFGQVFAIATVTVAVAAYTHIRRPAEWVTVVVLLSLALLSHPGVVQLTGVLAVGLALVWWLLGKRVGPRRSALLLGGAVAVSVALVFVLYYSHFVEQQLHELAAIQAERAAESAGKGFEALVGGSVTDKSLGLRQELVHSRSEWFWKGLDGFWAEAWAYFRGATPLWALLGFITLPLVWRGTMARRMAWGAGTWAGVVFIFALVGWIENLYVRYSLFGMPLVALGAGYLLAQIARRGRAGVWSAGLIAAYFAVTALVFWYQRVEFAFK